MSGHSHKNFAEPKREKLRVWPLLIVITVGIHVFILLGPDYIPIRSSWEPLPLIGTLILLAIPTLWGLFLLIKYQSFPERFVAYLALGAAGCWWTFWIASHRLRD
jgi:hypothetical protein